MAESAHLEIVTNTVITLEQKGFYLKKLDYSPIKGPKGNIEFIAQFSFNEKEKTLDLRQLIEHCVKKAHEEL